jgi:hypothetical protein
MPIPLFPPIFTAAPAEVAAEPDAAGVRSPPTDHSSGSGATSQQCHHHQRPASPRARAARCRAVVLSGGGGAGSGLRGRGARPQGPGKRTGQVPGDPLAAPIARLTVVGRYWR